MQVPHYIVGSESLRRRALTPGYGALHRGVGMRRRAGHINLATVGLWSLVGACALLAGMLSGLSGGAPY